MKGDVANLADIEGVDFKVVNADLIEYIRGTFWHLTKQMALLLDLSVPLEASLFPVLHRLVDNQKDLNLIKQYWFTIPLQA